MGVFTKLTIHKAAGDEVHLVADEGTGLPLAQTCGSLMYRAEQSVGMHNGGEMDKADDDPTKDVWTIETDEGAPAPTTSSGT